MFSPNLAVAVLTMMLRSFVDTCLAAPPISPAISGVEVASILAISAILVYVYERLKKGKLLKILFIPSTASIKSPIEESNGTENQFWVSAVNSGESLMRTAEDSSKALRAGSSANLSWKTAVSGTTADNLNKCHRESQEKIRNDSKSDRSQFRTGTAEGKRRLRTVKKPVSKVTKRSVSSRTRSGKVYSVLVE